jgi:hypothetical protein
LLRASTEDHGITWFHIQFRSFFAYRGNGFAQEEAVQTRIDLDISLPVAVPSFRSLDFGMNSGQVVVAVKSVSGAKSYFIRYAVMNGTTPGPWTTVPAATIRKPITVSGLTPITMYGFQVQALGVLGYSDWSTTETIVVN